MSLFSIDFPPAWWRCWSKDMVDILDVGVNSTSANHTSLSNFAFLYGVFPTAPSVAINGGHYNTELEVVINPNLNINFWEKDLITNWHTEVTEFINFVYSIISIEQFEEKHKQWNAQISSVDRVSTVSPIQFSSQHTVKCVLPMLEQANKILCTFLNKESGLYKQCMLFF